MGKVIDGKFQLAGNTVKRMVDGLSLEDIIRLKAVAERARQNVVTVDEVTAELADTPGLAEFAAWMGSYFKPKSLADLLSYLSLLVSIAGLLIPMMQQPAAPVLTEKQLVEVTANAVLAAMNQMQPKVRPSPHKSTVVRSKPKVSRNALCPCGSGKKRKKCCN